MFGKTISRLKKKRNISGQFPSAEPATETGVEDDLEPIKATLSNSSAVLSSSPSSPSKVLVSPAPDKVAEKFEGVPEKIQEPVQDEIHEKHQEEAAMAPASIISQNTGSAALSKKAAKAAAEVTVTHAEELSQEGSSSETEVKEKKEVKEVVETRSSVSTVVVTQKTESSTVSVAAQYVSGLITNLGEYEATMLRQTDLDSYLDSIADERLIHMPRKGSEWDRVLRTAQFFGLQIWRFGEKVGKFAPQSREAAAAALASCRMLLEIGHQHAAALLPAFMALYELGLLVSQITQIPGIFESDRAVKDDISRLYGDLVQLAGRVAVYYRRNISGLGQRRLLLPQQQNQRVTINLDAAFGQYIEAIWASKAALYERIWRQSMGRQTFAMDLAELRGRLNDDATAFRHALYAELSEDLERAEDTCEWVKADLADFLQSGDKFLSVTGGAGSGKTVLADWIEERLQRPLHNTTYSVLLYTFPYDDHEAASVLGFLKGVLFQLLERSVGNMKLYQSLVSAFASSEQAPQTRKQQEAALEAGLWKALQVGISTFKKSEEPIVLLLDGLDEVAGGQQSAVAGFVQQLRQNVAAVASAAKNVRIITFARHERQIPGARKIAMTTQELTPDIRNFLRQTLSRSQAFCSELAPAAREAVVDGLAQKAKGSFLWARLAGSYLLQQHQQSKTAAADELVKAAAAISPNVEDVLQLVVARLDLAGDRNLARLLTFLAVGDGVLAEADLADLLSVDVATQTLSPATDVAQLVFRTVPDLVLVRDGHVRFKSSLIRQHVQRQLGRALPPAKDAHAQLVLHLLLYAKLSIGSAPAAAAYREPTAEELDEAVSRRLLQRYRLLPFVMARWVHHFRASSLIQSGGELALSHDFRAVFPDTAVFALLERQVWARSLPSSPPTELIAQLTLTLRIRDKVFGGEHGSKTAAGAGAHVAVLQSLIVLGQVHLAAGHSVEGARYLYRAVAGGRALLGDFSPVVITCTELFLSASAAMVFTSRTDIFKYREELIRFKIETLRARYGAYSELVTVWYRTLAAMYVAVKEEHQAAVVYRELHDITVALHGSDSQEAREITTFVGGLDVDLQDSESKKEIPGFGHELLVTAESLDDKDVLRVSIELNAARSYESEQQWQLAERVYIGLWRRVSALTHTSATAADVHAAKLQVALAYTGFLRTQKRAEEAANILMVVWTEYEHRELASEEVVGYLRDVAVLFREVGLLTVSASILSRVWTWYREKGRADDEVARKTTVLVTEVVREITETTVTTRTTALTTTTTTTATTTTTEETEKVVRDVFQAELRRCSHDRKALDATFFASALALASTHAVRGRWEEAETAIRQSLEASWPELLLWLGGDGVRDSTKEVRLSAAFSHETVRLAVVLADGYTAQRQYEKAEAVRVALFRATSASLAPDDALSVKAVAGLVAFYEAHHRHEAVVDVYAGLLRQQYRAKLGAAHSLTIAALYALAAQHELLGRSREAVACYGEIAAALNAGRASVHPDAFSASVALVRFLCAEKRWAELEAVSALLWETLVHHRAESASYRFTDDVAALAYEAHAGVLEHHRHRGTADVAALLYQAATQYRDVAVAAFGAASSAVVAAQLALAAVAERSEQHQLEALSIYEEVLARSKTTTSTTTTTTTTSTSTVLITETTVQTVRRRLSQLYVTVITTPGSSKDKAKALPAGTVERAVAVSLEAYAQLRQEHGVWHDVALAKLRDVVVLLQRVATKESQARVAQLVQSAVVDIVSAQAGAALTTVQLYKAATTLATTVFVSTGLVTVGRELLRQLRLRLIFGNALPAGVSAASSTPTLPPGIHSRTVFLFLAAFEQRLAGSTDKAGAATFSELLSSLLYEAFLYDEYRAAFASSATSPDVVVVAAGIQQLLQHGARLRRFWAEDGKAELVRVLDAQLFPVFKRAYGAQVKAAGTSVADEHLVLFYAALLVELGKDRAKAGFAVVAASAGIAQVRQLLEAADYARALELARFVHVFCATQGYYRSATATASATAATDGAGIGYGYRLAGLLAGLDVRTEGSAAAPASPPAALREKLLALSRTVTAELFAVLEAQNIDLAALEVADVDGLVRLLGAQADYGRLEMLLLRLWQSREVRRSWRPATVLSIGFALVHAYAAAAAADGKAGHAAGRLDRAIELADLLCYNLRRSRGWLDRDALAAGQLLASLYVEAGRVADAMAVHESVLRQIEAASAGAGAATRAKNQHRQHHHVEDADGDRAALAAHARQQLDLLRAAHVRLGRWVKPRKEYQELYDHLREALALQPQLPLPFDKWLAAAMTANGANGANSSSKAALPGCYVSPSVLRIEDSVLVSVPSAPLPIGAK